MTRYDIADLVWARESSYGETPSYSAGDQFYRFGIMAKPVTFPDPEWVIEEITEYNSRRTSYLTTFQKNSGEITGFLDTLIPLYFAMGNSTNSDETSYYQHILTGLGIGDELPSILLHRQIGKGGISTSAWASDCIGTKFDKFVLEGKENEALSFKASVVGKKVQNGVVSTQAFADPTGSIRKLWRFKGADLQYKSDTNIAHLMSFSIGIDNGLQQIKTRAGGKYLEFLHEGDHIKYQLSFGYLLEDYTVLDDFLSATERTHTLELERGGDPNDSFLCSFDTSIIKSFKVQAPQNQIGKVGAVVIVIPKDLTVTIKDQIDGDDFYV